MHQESATELGLGLRKIALDSLRVMGHMALYSLIEGTRSLQGSDSKGRVSAKLSHLRV